MASETATAAHAPAHEHDPAHEHAPGESHAAGHGHGLLHHHFDDMKQQAECNSLAMWLFLMTEIMMFGGLFFAYTLYRWLYPVAYLEGSEHLNITLGTVNTFVLLFSSLTMAMAVHSAVVRQRKALLGWLGATWLLGAAFIVVKYFEWGHDWHIGLIPGLNWTYYDNHPQEALELAAKGTGTHHVLMYWVIYFSMTGLHAIHMVIGLGMVGWFMVLAWKQDHFGGGNHQPVEIVGLYWHFVDIVWVFLFPLLYLIAGFHPFGGGH